METSKYASLNFPCREEEGKNKNKTEKAENNKNNIERVIRLLFLILSGIVG